uniref:Zinc finger protein B385R homolog protein n=1 Tax=Abalone asfa-like virus TaxID=2839893 RepID=A0A5K7XWZ4_9VIRU|nr:Zinc finger protein B385R homolog protein [Abalone asfa-like virus]BCY04569.1 Poxvirus VLTF3, late transcription factor [Abalone asfa-like virus]
MEFIGWTILLKIENIFYLCFFILENKSKQEAWEILYPPSPTTNSEFSLVLNQLSEFRNKFYLETCRIFLDVIENKNDKLNTNATLLFNTFLIELNTIIEKIVKIIRSRPVTTRENNLAELLSTQLMLSDQQKNTFINYIDYKICNECGFIMQYNLSSNSLLCASCNFVKQPIDAEANIMSTALENRKKKSAAFNPSRHYKFWINHILARNTKNILHQEKNINVLSELNKIIVRDRKSPQLLTVEDVRSMLKEINRTDLNNSTSLLLYKLTGIAPPQLTPKILLMGEKIFADVIKVRNVLCLSGRINRNYYPFYIYKIFDIIIPPEIHEFRKILSYIHLQSEETLVNNDNEWWMICQRLPDIPWRPTIRQ